MVLDAMDSNSKSDAIEPSSMQDSAVAWMFRGVMVGVLVLGSANALSFFFRSRGWGSLLGNREPDDEAIGFPMMIWQEGAGYASHQLKYIPFAVDITTALVLGAMVGAIAISQRHSLNQIMDRARREASGGDARLQFSLRDLLITTVVAAAVAAAARSFVPRVELLAAIYAFGPIALILFAYVPRRLSWKQRVAVLTPATIMLIAAAIALGGALDVEFDKVLMGIFICWTPQAAIGAVVLSAVLLVKEYRQLGNV